jgi:hypothetical protein
MHDPTDLNGQERATEADNAKAREIRRKELEDLRWLVAHPQGRRIAARILERAGVHRTSFNHSGSVMAFNEGQRNIGLFVQSELLEAAPEGYFKILKEYAGK